MAPAAPCLSLSVSVMPSKHFSMHCLVTCFLRHYSDCRDPVEGDCTQPGAKTWPKTGVQVPYNPIPLPVTSAATEQAKYLPIILNRGKDRF